MRGVSTSGTGCAHDPGPMNFGTSIGVPYRLEVSFISQIICLSLLIIIHAAVLQRVCCLLSGGVHLYVSDQLGILTEQPEGEGSSEASIMAESQDKVGLRACQ